MPIYLPTRWLITTPYVSDPDVFPLLAGQVFVTQKSPVFSTNIKKAVAGRETRASYFSVPLWKFEVGYEVLRENGTNTEWQRLMAFFMSRAGRYGIFYYLDPSDHIVADQSIGTGNGVKATFQLSRTLSLGGASPYIEPIWVVQGTPIVTVAGAATTAFTIGNYGQITFTTPPANGADVRWSGNFMFLCRFDQDELETAQLVDTLWEARSLTFVSLKP